MFAAQQDNQWAVKASSAAQRKAKLAKLKAAVEEHADAIVAAVLEDIPPEEAGVNIVSGFMITDRMLKMFKKTEAPK